MTTASKAQPALVISANPEDISLTIDCPAPGVWPAGARGTLVVKRADNGATADVLSAALAGMTFPLSGVTPGVAAKVMQDIANFIRSTTGGYA